MCQNSLYHYHFTEEVIRLGILTHSENELDNTSLFRRLGLNKFRKRTYRQIQTYIK